MKFVYVVFEIRERRHTCRHDDCNSLRQGRSNEAVGATSGQFFLVPRTTAASLESEARDEW